ncbi:hypothetical protein HK102_010070 [Quaeritorhiza haematococci]|nr:hypothetical protein HK102_010070 [Quaeritorhiza haematococci]
MDSLRDRLALSSQSRTKRRRPHKTRRLVPKAEDEDFASPESYSSDASVVVRSSSPSDSSYDGEDDSGEDRSDDDVVDEEEEEDGDSDDSYDSEDDALDFPDFDSEKVFTMMVPILIPLVAKMLGRFGEYLTEDERI